MWQTGKKHKDHSRLFQSPVIFGEYARIADIGWPPFRLCNGRSVFAIKKQQL